MSQKIIADLDILHPEEKQASDLAKISTDINTGKKRKLYIESYGCQMNFSDSEIVTSIMHDNGFDTTSDIRKADVVFLNTCSIRDNAEQKIRMRLTQINSEKRQHNPEMVVGILGCMAERLKSKLIEEEKIVDMVVGPDAYRDLPNLIASVDDGEKAINVFLSREETYDDITPVRLNSNGVSAMISIMRGCDNMCSFCVVPYTRGRERSRDPESIVKEAQDLVAQGYKEVMLLGQNVDSFKWKDESKNVVTNFAQLLEMVALVSANLRVRFSTSHPKDITDEVLYTIKKYENICNYVHLPVQSGSNRILEMMTRTYTREWYMERVDAIRRILGDDCGMSSDSISGFCSETEEDHQDTLSIFKYANYDFSYMFAYSERPNTPAAKKYKDDIDEKVKGRRLAEIIKLQAEISNERNAKCVGQVYQVLVDGYSKKSDQFLSGKNGAYKTVVFPKGDYKKGDYVDVLIESFTSATLLGKALNYSK